MPLRTSIRQPFSATNYGETKLSSLDGSMVDASGRLRVAEIASVFDQKQLFDNRPLFWDDQEVSGSGTGSSHSVNTATTTLTVGATTAGKRARQSFRSLNYQPGKGALIEMTGTLSSGGSGIDSSVGLFDDNNGIMFSCIDDVVSFNIRSSTSGSPVDSRINQIDWNLDKMDGTGPSGVTLDPTKLQIFVIDFLWYGSGRVRGALRIDGMTIYVHEVVHENLLTVPYMSRPNLPLRYEIENDGTGPASSMEHGCVSVSSEGGSEHRGILLYESTATNRVPTTKHIDANTADTLYAIVALQLKSAYIGTSVELVSMSMVNENAQDFEWLLCFNPTLSAALSFGDKANSALQTAIGEQSNPSTTTLSATGTVLAGGFQKSGNTTGAVTEDLRNALTLGSNIAGVPDVVVLAARPLAINADFHGGLEWRELS